MDDVVVQHVAGAVGVDVDRPARIGQHHDCIIDNDVVLGAAGGVDVVDRNPIGVIAVDQVIANDAVLNAVAVDRPAPAVGPGAESVVVEGVVLDQGMGNQPRLSLAQVAVEMDARAGIMEDGIAPHHRAVATVGDVDAVGVLGARGAVVLDGDAVAEGGVDAHVAGVADDVVADDDIVVDLGGDAAVHRVVGILHREAVDDDPARPLHVDTLGRLVVAIADDRPGLAAEGDGVAGGAALLAIPANDEAGVAAGAGDDGVPRLHDGDGVLERFPWGRCRAIRAIVARWRDVIRAEQHAILQQIDLRPVRADITHGCSIVTDGRFAAICARALVSRARERAGDDSPDAGIIL